MKNQLLPFQATAVDWLCEHPRGGYWDEQGLGKTIGTIVAADQLGLRRMLVVCPASILYNWHREIKRWCSREPHRFAQVIHNARQEITSTIGWVITTHGLLLKEEIRKQLVDFDLIVLDEAHLMRKPTAKRTSHFFLGKDAICRRAPRCWLLTGTPMANHAGELWTALAGLAPKRLQHYEELPGDRVQPTGKLMNFAAFLRRYCVLAPSGFGKGYKVVGLKNAAELRKRLAGFALRRLQKDVMPDLPPIRWGTVALTCEGVVPQVSYDHLTVDGTLDDTLDDLKRDEGFSAWRHACGLAKVKPALEVLRSDLDSGMQKVIVIAHHLDVIEQLREGLKDYHPIVLTGATAPRTRQELVDCFQTVPSRRVFIAQITAGGIGVTLTAAADVVFVEQSPVPGDNAQAAKRAHRIGQTRPVLVRFFALANSVDEVLADILSRKTQMISTVLNEP